MSLKKLEPELTSLRPSANQLSGIWSYVGKSPNSCSILQTPYGLLLENEDGGYTIGILSEDHTIINAAPKPPLEFRAGDNRKPMAEQFGGTTELCGQRTSESGSVATVDV